MLEVVTADAEGLAGSVASTKDLSERVSSKVRELDAAQVWRLRKSCAAKRHCCQAVCHILPVLGF